MQGTRPRRPTGTTPKALFDQAVWDKLWGGELEFNDSDTIKVNKGTKGITFDAKIPSSAINLGRLNPRGGWTLGEVYKKFDMVHVTEKFSLPINAFVDSIPGDAALFPPEVAASTADLFVYETWYWMQEKPTNQEPNANPHAPSLFADPLSDPATWPFKQYPDGVPFFSPTVISQGAADGDPINPLDPARSWTLLSAVPLPLNWGTDKVIKFKDKDGNQHALLIWGGQIILDSY